MFSMFDFLKNVLVELMPVIMITQYLLYFFGLFFLIRAVQYMRQKNASDLELANKVERLIQLLEQEKKGRKRLLD